MNSLHLKSLYFVFQLLILFFVFLQYDSAVFVLLLELFLLPLHLVPELLYLFFVLLGVIPVDTCFDLPLHDPPVTFQLGYLLCLVSLKFLSLLLQGHSVLLFFSLSQHHPFIEFISQQSVLLLFTLRLHNSSFSISRQYQVQLLPSHKNTINNLNSLFSLNLSRFLVVSLILLLGSLEERSIVLS